MRRHRALGLTIALLATAVGAGCTQPAAEGGPPVRSDFVVLDLSESVIRGDNQRRILDCLALIAEDAWTDEAELTIRVVGTTADAGAVSLATVAPAEVSDNQGQLAEWVQEQIAGAAEALGGPVANGGGATTDLTGGLVEARNHFRATGADANRLVILSDFIQTEGDLDLNLFVDDGKLDLGGWGDVLVTGVQGDDSDPEDALRDVRVLGVALQDGSSDIPPFARDEVQRAWLDALEDLGASGPPFDTSTNACGQTGANGER